MEDFIEVYPDALSATSCARLIERFEASAHIHPGQVGSGVDRSLKDSRDLSISPLPDWRDAEQLLNKAMMRALCQYLRRYPHVLIAPLAIQWRDPVSSQARLLTAEDLQQMDDAQLAPFARHAFRPGTINLQHYQADRGAYSYWHCEQYPRTTDCESLHRVLLWTLYLNDGFTAGETEFLYQRRKIQPATGSLLLAPAAFTHTHRGNCPQGADKYIATSWVLFRRAEELFVPERS